MASFIQGDRGVQRGERETLVLISNLKRLGSTNRLPVFHSFIIFTFTFSNPSSAFTTLSALYILSFAQSSVAIVPHTPLTTTTSSKLDALSSSPHSFDCLKLLFSTVLA